MLKRSICFITILAVTELLNKTNLKLILFSIITCVGTDYIAYSFLLAFIEPKKYT